MEQTLTLATTLKGVLLSEEGAAVPDDFATLSEDMIAKGYKRLEHGLEVTEADGKKWYLPAVRHSNDDSEDDSLTYILLNGGEVATVSTEDEGKLQADLAPLNRTLNGQPVSKMTLTRPDSRRLAAYTEERLQYEAQVEDWKKDMRVWKNAGCRGMQPLPPNVPNFTKSNGVQTTAPRSSLAEKLFPNAVGVFYITPGRGYTSRSHW